MSKPIVVIVCMVRSSESWEPQQRPHPWHRCAGGGAVHSIKTGLTHRPSSITWSAVAKHSSSPTSVDGDDVGPRSNIRVTTHRLTSRRVLLSIALSECRKSKCRASGCPAISGRDLKEVNHEHDRTHLVWIARDSCCRDCGNRTGFCTEEAEHRHANDRRYRLE